jgi:hypothetical protein
VHSSLTKLQEGSPVRSVAYSDVEADLSLGFDVEVEVEVEVDPRVATHVVGVSLSEEDV